MNCLYCNKELEHNKRKYCNEEHGYRFRYSQLKDEYRERARKQYEIIKDNLEYKEKQKLRFRKWYERNREKHIENCMKRIDRGKIKVIYRNTT